MHGLLETPLKHWNHILDPLPTENVEMLVRAFFPPLWLILGGQLYFFQNLLSLGPSVFLREILILMIVNLSRCMIRVFSRLSQTLLLLSPVAGCWCVGSPIFSCVTIGLLRHLSLW